MEKRSVLIAICNQKGGVGKSVLTTLAASYLHIIKKKNVAIVDCDFPQHSIYNMREDDRKTVNQSPELQIALTRQFETYNKKAYPILKSNPESAMTDAFEIIDNMEQKLDVVFFDLPGTVNNAGIINLILNMDYIFVPIIADKRILQSSLAFILAIKEYIKKFDERIMLKEVYAFWNKVDKREHTELYEEFNEILKNQNVYLLRTELPDTKKYNKELSVNRTLVFRSTLFPPDNRQLKNSNLDKLVSEMSKIIKL